MKDYQAPGQPQQSAKDSDAYKSRLDAKPLSGLPPLTLHRREITMPDGRYLFFYTFSSEASSSENESSSLMKDV